MELRTCFSEWNHNVVVHVLLRLTSGFANSVWHGTVFVTFVYGLTGSNAFAGSLDAVQNVSALLCSLPIGWLADRWSASGVIALCALLVPVAAALTALAAVCGESISSFEVCRGGKAEVFLLVAQACWGAIGAAVDGPAQAMYAGSMRRADRSHFYTIAFVAYTLAGAAGRLLTICMFLAHGNAWDLSTLRDAVLVGVAFELLAGGCMLGYRSKAIVDEPREHANYKDSSPREAESEAPENVSEPACSDWIWLMPYVQLSSNLCFSWGAGMTVRFFPLFFERDCQLTPVGVQSVYLILPLVIALSSNVAAIIAKRLGRVLTIVLIRGAGCLLLVLMYIYADVRSDSPQQGPLSVWRPHVLFLVGLFLMRSGLANCTTPLSSALLMDYVSPTVRARWAGLGGSVVKVSWAASAAIGGVLADQYGYRFTFLLTALLQGVGTILQASLLTILPSSEGLQPQVFANPVKHDLSKPLLAVR
ncbi:hypothetical protein AB1Y20_015463 [Prymnesium parvum]|uniref:Major facilitator superfamily (MFS) profile domain-containing protein n=1 Tax=Prymnesium parvum TaxID=97485 RepID=A0AB34K0L0_PRYPA